MDKNNTETGSVSGEASSQGAASGAASTPPSTVDVKALADALRPIIAEEVNRRAQSDKDSRIARLSSKVDSFAEKLKRLEELKADGMSEKAALRFMDLEDRLPPNQDAGSSQAQAPQAKPGGTGEATASELTQALIGALSLDANDAEVTAALREQEFTSQANLLIALAARRKKAAEAPANPAQQMPVGGGASIPSENKDQIAAEILRLSNESPAKNYARIQALNAKLKTIK